jgi:hypothetical protein
MLSEKINTHNEVNGVAFSVAEFALIVLVMTPIAVYYLLHTRLVSAAVAAGIAANALAVVALGLRALAHKQRGGSVLRWFDRHERATLALRYPHLTRDTLMITVTTLIPFILLLLVLHDSITTRNGHS